MTNYFVSICIPTYNRSDLIDNTLLNITNIVSNSMRPVQICISNNASTDNTEDIIRKYSLKYNYIKYYKQKENVGFDRNITTVMDMADGKFCWLMGDDDAILENSIDKIIGNLLTNNADITLCNRIDCSNDLVPRSYNYAIKTKVDSFYDFSKIEDIKLYLSLVANLCGLFSFISTLIIKKEKYSKLFIDDDILKGGYVHVYIVLTVLQQGGKLSYISEPLVLCRLDKNDLSKSRNYVNRFMLDINSYDEIFLKIKINDELLQSYYKGLRVEHPFYHLLKLTAVATRGEWGEICLKLEKIGYNRFYLKFLGLSSVRLTLAILLKIYLKYFKTLLLFISEKNFSIKNSHKHHSLF